ncbi:MAG: Asp-tRNA(Asn)/Glu-tRNA(Gln) amidotransferase subunit GatC [Candidatus Omnitrophica bacterium]|nr:Asp-tRNA(Asn)/Glu-tRNA(Gln) amidotransferase subunit GatC [Candidatus Omnitrophota bacterium]
MGIIKKKDVLYVASLARIKLADGQIEGFTGQLDSILDYIKQLDEVDTESVQPTSHVLPMVNVFRKDDVKPSLPQEKVLENAPGKEGYFFKVPKVIDGAEK